MTFPQILSNQSNSFTAISSQDGLPPPIKRSRITREPPIDEVDILGVAQLLPLKRKATSKHAPADDTGLQGMAPPPPLKQGRITQQPPTGTGGGRPLRKTAKSSLDRFIRPTREPDDIAELLTNLGRLHIEKRPSVSQQTNSSKQNSRNIPRTSTGLSIAMLRIR